MSTPCSWLPLLFWPLLLLSLSHWLFAVALAVALTVAVAVVAVAVAVAFDLPGSLPQRRMDRGKIRRAAHRDVRRSRQGQDAPSANPRHGRGPGARSAEGARQGALSFGYFSLREQRKVTRRKAKALLLLLFLRCYCLSPTSKARATASAGAGHFSLLVQRKVTKRKHTPQRALRATRSGSAAPTGIFRWHIHVPAKNVAHPARRPSSIRPPGLPR
ncbi:hypothetical protein [Xanthomonas graminis]|uniref:hypothetical protein n=1 Tax=Xanthomonas graminis TaxID=3390026 RepID=UPI00147B3BE7|nr:hypothetical protein [Xanthomonas translucens]